jgi:hypothetical protein
LAAVSASAFVLPAVAAGEAKAEEADEAAEEMAVPVFISS